MLQVDNKYFIGDTAYTYARVPIHVDCPICGGKGVFITVNGYDVKCQNCQGSGKIKIEQHILEPCKVKIRGIKLSYNQFNQLSITYKVSCETHNVKSRSEHLLYPTMEEAQSRADAINKGEITGEF